LGSRSPWSGVKKTVDVSLVDGFQLWYLLECRLEGRFGGERLLTCGGLIRATFSRIMGSK
jgi:hypothetical protein